MKRLVQIPLKSCSYPIVPEQKARTTYDNILRFCDDYDVKDPIRFLRAREVVHYQRFGENLRLLTDKLNEKNFYAFNPSFDKKCFKNAGKTFGLFLAGLVGGLVNTILVMNFIFFLFKPEYAQVLGEAGDAVYAAIISVIFVQGVPEAMLRQAAQMSVCKINIDTDLRLAMTASVREYLAQNPSEFDPRKYLGPARDAIKGMVAHKIKNVLGSSNKL